MSSTGHRSKNTFHEKDNSRTELVLVDRMILLKVGQADKVTKGTMIGAELSGKKIVIARAGQIHERTNSASCQRRRAICPS
jgi:hypothetical protein